MKIRNFRKLNIKAMILCLTASAFTMSVLLPTMSWFNADTSSPISVDGNIHGSYFESGDGTAANPFEIARPIQLYYLSWLQEMGYFNEAEEYPKNSGQYRLKQQYHFYLSKDLNLNDTDNNETYILPPIGTIKYPFIGSFDGKGHVISNLTITNYYSTYTKDPRHPTSSSTTHSDSYEILGLFGVLGTTESTNEVSCSIIEADGTIHQLQDNGGDNILISYNDGETYNYVKSTYLDNITIIASTDSAHALAGAVAGYSNAHVENIGIKGATLSFASGRQSLSEVGATNLSDYTAFGFVEPEFKRSVDLINEQVYDPKATQKTYVSNSSGTAWGGSIDMATLLKRTFKSQHMSSTTQTVPEYPKYETHIYDGDQYISTDTTYDNLHYGRIGNKYGTNYSTKTSFYYSDKEFHSNSSYTGEESVGSYYIADTTSNNSPNVNSSDSYHKAYLGGMSDIPSNTGKTVYYFNYSNSPEECYYVRSDSNTNTDNFIGINTNGTINKVSTQTAAVKWHLLSNGHLKGHAKIYDTSTNVSSSPSQPREQIYYLNYSNGNFAISTSETNATVWTLNNGKITLPSVTGYTIRTDATHYLSNNATSITNTNNSDAATLWNIPNYTSGTSGTITTTVNGTTYYLYAGNYNNTNNNLTLSTSNTANRRTVYWRTANATSTYLYYTNSSYIQYINVNGTTWRTTRANATNNNINNATTLYIDYVERTTEFPTVSTTEKPFSLSSGQAERSGQAGYIPLAAVGDTVWNPDDENSVDPFAYGSTTLSQHDQYFYTSPMNTGYIVGGYYDKYNGKGSGSLQTGNYGDVRIAQYSHFYVCGSYNWGTNRFTNLYTINDSSYSNNKPVTFDENGDSTSSNYSGNLNFVKLSSALKNLNKTLKANAKNNDTHWISGVHFMDSTISLNRTITADKVLINGVEKSNYEMPEDSIDFHLKEKGYINFFAGNYHEENNSFFALHKIERDANDRIISAKKIKYVFKNADDPLGNNIYLYDDEGSGYTWSDGEPISSRPVSKNDFTVNGETYEFAFDTKWIDVKRDANNNVVKANPLIPNEGNSSKPSRDDTDDLDYKRIYYFEIPVNDGEYALGSCEGGCGGYLIYLDISAAAQTVERKTINEMFTIDTISGDIPYGTQYISSYPAAQIETDSDGKEITTAIVRSDIENIDDLNSYYGSITPNADGTYTISRNGSTITVTNDPALISKYIGDGMTLSGGSVTGRTQRRIRRITDYDYNTVTDAYVRQITTIVIEGTGSTAHNYATTTIEYNETGFNAPFTLVARYSYDWIGDGPNFTYAYYLRSTGSSNGLEVIFNNVSNNDFWLTVEYVDSNFQLSCGLNGLVTPSQIPAVVDEDHPYPRIQIEPSTGSINSEEWTKWYDFNLDDGGFTDDGSAVTPTVIGTFKYTREGSQQITENFVYSGYGCIEAVTTYEDIETVISDDGNYIFEFILSGSDPVSSSSNPAVTVYYICEGVFYIRYADGTEYIAFVNTGTTNPLPNP